MIVRLNGDKIELGLDPIAEVMRRGVRRAAAFVGFGVNASNNPDLREVHLPNEVSNLVLLPEVIHDEALTELKREFGAWVQAGGFRELCEALEQYATALYGACSVIASVKDGKVSSCALVGVPKAYERDGLKGKLAALGDRFGVGPAEPGHLASLWAVRNCMTHRRGIVGPSDVSGAEILSVRWMGLDTVYRDEADGVERPMGPGFEPFRTLGGGEVMARLVERTRELRLGERATFSPHDLSEIFWSCLRASDQMMSSLLKFAEARGMPIEVRPVPAPANAPASGRE